MTPAGLIAFEDDLRKEFEAGHIRAPLHLAGGNEKILIEIFKTIAPTDFVCCTWRAHYHALLHGVPPETAKAAILAGRSIALCFAAHNFISSAIVGGIAPIAVGLAAGAKRNNTGQRVHCFLGDGAYECGVVYESIKYASAHGLPIRWIVENNHISGTGVPTREVWGTWKYPNVEKYEYTMTTPFVGTGKWIPL